MRSALKSTLRIEGKVQAVKVISYGILEKTFMSLQKKKAVHGLNYLNL